jgi:hypothetical protein
VQKLGRGQTGEHLVPIDRSRFREVYKVEEAVGVVVWLGIIWACEGEPMTADFVGILAGLLGHGIDQFDVAHDRESPGKRERTGTQKRPAAREADGKTGSQSTDRGQSGGLEGRSRQNSSTGGREAVAA